jgi:type VI secretion system secreted protein VgrG
MSRMIDITTPLDKDVLLIRAMRGTEEMSRLFEYELELLSHDGEVNFDELLGKGVTIHLEKADETTRHFHGLVSRVSQGAKQGRYHTYHATVRPWLWFLTRTRNYRIFQEKTVPDVVKEIFGQHPIADVKFELTESYTPWTYCVQYNESDFAFVSRLMEHEGIYYYFTHEDGRHTLVIADSYSAHAKVYEDDLPYLSPEQVRPEQEYVSEWSIAREVRSGKYALSAYDFEKPSVDLQVKSNIPREYALADYEVFEYGGDYIDRGDGETYVRARIEEEQAKFERVRGVSTGRALSPGGLFTLGLHPRADQNAEYLIVSAAYDMKSGEYEARDEGGASYSVAFTSLNTKYPFRAERLTEKPIVQGPQTAIVVGPSGEDIYTDKFGRIKVHFYWDRYGKRDDKSSCWIRVSQNWGGKGWGGMFIPHVGQEVIVMFEGGDPDLPLVTGRVYNAENMPPVELPGGKTQSIIRDHGANEIKMEGEGGKQSIRMFSPHANTVFKIGAPNEPFQGFFFKTDQEWNEYVNANKRQVDADGNVTEHVNGSSHSHTVGTVDTSILGDSNYYLRGNYICRVDGKQEYSTSGDYVTKVYGKNWVTILGADVDSYLSLQHSTNVGVRTGIMLAAQFNFVSGAKFEFDKAVYTYKTPLKKYMLGQEKKQVGEAMQAFGKRREKVAGILESKAAQLHQSAAKMKLVAKGLAHVKAAAWELKAKKMEWEGSRMIAKGKKKFEGGVLQVNNALKCLT